MCVNFWVLNCVRNKTKHLQIELGPDGQSESFGICNKSGEARKLGREKAISTSLEHSSLPVQCIVNLSWTQLCEEALSLHNALVVLVIGILTPRLGKGHSAQPLLAGHGQCLSHLQGRKVLQLSSLHWALEHLHHLFQTGPSELIALGIWSSGSWIWGCFIYQKIFI